METTKNNTAAPETNGEETVNAENTAKAEKTSKKKKNDDAAKKLIADLLEENDKLKQTVSDAKKVLDETSAELEGQKEAYARMLSEYENYRRRTAEEKEKLGAEVSADIIVEFLPVLDNLERASECSADSDADSAIREGVSLVLRSFRETLEKMGVSEIPALGEQFDPNLHNAVMKEDDETKGENEITAVFQKGYMLGDKVIRYSVVRVAN